MLVMEALTILSFFLNVCDPVYQMDRFSNCFQSRVKVLKCECMSWKLSGNANGGFEMEFGVAKIG